LLNFRDGRRSSLLNFQDVQRNKCDL